jgi:AAA+ ATPase superfamily predicted ATPase
MAKFVDREAELVDLDRFAARLGGQFIIVYGRRRAGKPQL